MDIHMSEFCKYASKNKQYTMVIFKSFSSLMYLQALHFLCSSSLQEHWAILAMLWH